jgi:uncharacterized lipoprotein YddW (UPF0748 family)
MDKDNKKRKKKKKKDKEEEEEEISNHKLQKIKKQMADISEYVRAIKQGLYFILHLLRVEPQGFV